MFCRADGFRPRLTRGRYVRARGGMRDESYRSAQTCDPPSSRPGLATVWICSQLHRRGPELA